MSLDFANHGELHPNLFVENMVVGQTLFDRVDQSITVAIDISGYKAPLSDTRLESRTAYLSQSKSGEKLTLAAVLWFRPKVMALLKLQCFTAKMQKSCDFEGWRPEFGRFGKQRRHLVSFKGDWMKLW